MPKGGESGEGSDLLLEMDKYGSTATATTSEGETVNAFPPKTVYEHAALVDILETEAEEEAASPRRFTLAWLGSQLRELYVTHSFLVSIIAAILLAFAYPPLGAHYLQPQITSTWVAVMAMFVIAGLGLKTKELSKALQRVGFNAFVQLFNYVVVSLIVFLFSRSLINAGILPRTLADGMVICSCLPVTVSMILVLTTSANGDDAAAVFAAAFGNLTGVFFTPALILTYLGVRGDVDLLGVFTKLSLRVLVPLTVGQLFQKFYAPTLTFVAKHKKRFKGAQEWCLVYIVYCVFCRTFETGMDASVGNIFLMIALQIAVLCAVMALAWTCLEVFFRDEPKLRVTGLFACTQKTVALGVPLINAIYENDPNAGLYTLPLIVWHPMQLVLGSALTPYLVKFVKREERRLGRSPSMRQQPRSDSIV